MVAAMESLFSTDTDKTAHSGPGATGTQWDELKKNTIPADLDARIDALSRTPAQSLVGVDELERQKQAISQDHLTQLGALHGNLAKLSSVHLPHGYDPESEHFASEKVLVDVHTGLLSTSVTVQITYSPPQRGLLGSTPAKLKGALVSSHDCFSLKSVNISNSGQTTLSDGGEWSHERVCEEVAQYIFFLCREAESLVKQNHVEEKYVDFDPEFEAHLVRKIALATNLLQLPEYYRAFTDRETSKELAVSEAARVKTHAHDLEVSVDAELGALKDRLAALNTTLASEAGLDELKHQAHEEAQKVLAEVRDQTRADETAQLEAEKATLTEAIAKLAEEIAALQKSKEEVLDELSPPKIRSRILDLVNRRIGKGRLASPITSLVIDSIAEVYNPKDPAIFLDLDNFVYFADLALQTSAFTRVLQTLPLRSEQKDSAGVKAEAYSDPDKARHAYSENVNQWYDQLARIAKCLRFLANNCTKAEVEILKQGLRQMSPDSADEITRCSKTLLGKGSESTKPVFLGKGSGSTKPV